MTNRHMCSGLEHIGAWFVTIPGTESVPPRVKVDVVVLTLSRLPFLSVLLLTLEFLGDAVITNKDM